MSDSFQSSIGDNSVSAEIIPWDSATFGFTVCNLSYLSIQDLNIFEGIWLDFIDWSRNNSVKLITLRVKSNMKNEMNFLQKKEFLMMENTSQPIISNLHNFMGSKEISIEKATPEDLPIVIEIARTSFDVSRFHSDSKIDNIKANLRYVNWIKNFSTPDNLWVTKKNNEVIAFFLTERSGDESYWHLTAMNNKFKGKGLGKKSWIKMLEQEHLDGIKTIKTRISMENFKVLNLYKQLGANFYNHETSFHLHI